MRQLFFLITLIIGFSGCFDEPSSEGESSDNSSTISISGSVVDGYVKKAIVFIDYDGNSLLGFAEPSTVTDENGYYEFKNVDSSKLSSRPSIIAVGGIDTTTNEKFTGKFSSYIEKVDENSEVNLTPITTILDKLLNKDATDEDILDAKEKVAVLFELDKDKLRNDPIKEFSTNPELYKKAITIVKLMELINHKADRLQNKYNFESGMNALRDKLEDGESFKDLKTVSLSGRVINIEDELDLISGDTESFIEIPSNGNGYGGDLDDVSKYPVKPDLTDEEKVSLVKELITANRIRGLNSSLENVSTNLNLKINPYRTTVTWTSTNESFIKSDGTVIQPENNEGSQSITLTATIKKGAITDTKSFVVKVIAKTVSDSVAVENSKNLLTFDKIKKENTTVSQIVSNLELKTFDSLNDVSISWSSSNNSILSNSGVVTRPNFEANDENIELIATLTKGSINSTVTFNLTVLKVPLTDELAVQSAYNSLDVNDILGANTNSDEITQNLDLFTSSFYNTTISWSSSDEVISTTGVVTRDLSLLYDKTIDLIATITKGQSTLTKTLSVTVLGMSDQEILNADILTLNFDLIKLSNQTTNNITTNLNLPTTLQYGSSVSWSSSSQFLQQDGTVIIPDISEGYFDENIELNAYVTYNGASQNVIFNVIIKAVNKALINAVEADKEALTFDVIKDKNTQIDKISSNLFLPTTGSNGSTITWESSDTNILSLSGVVSRPSYEEGTKQITLKATITKDEISDTKEFYLTVLSSLQVNSSLSFSDEVYGVDGNEENSSKTFRRNGITYSLKLYSNLIVDETLISSDKNIYEISGLINGIDLASSLKLPSDYKNQEILLKLYRSDTEFTNENLIESKKIVLNSSTVNFIDFDLSDEDSLRIPSPNLADVEFINLPAKF